MSVDEDAPTDADLWPKLVFEFDGKGGGREIAAAEFEAHPSEAPEGGFMWIHLQHGVASTDEFLAAGGLDEFIVEALTAVETRPRCTVHGDGALVNLRGVNPTPEGQPDVMISVRLWIDQKRVIGVWVRALNAVVDLIEAARRGHAPMTPGDFVARLALRLADRAEPVTAELNERVDALEEALLEEGVAPSRIELADVRQTAIGLRRFMFPQRDALSTMQIEDLPWLTPTDRSRLREAADRVTRLGEELDAIRDRAEVIHDQIMDRRADLLGRRTLLLSIVAALFLPMSLLSGMMGMNVAVPGADFLPAFWVVSGLMVLIAVIQFGIFKLFKLI
ncbi:MAG TPA: zinc transporter ZntB [Phycisphaerae bacterium]|nr:zinc transporter ZntB [Phycisphaerae bacterium]